MKRLTVVVPFLLCCLLLGQQPAWATEGGASYYLPGAPVTFATAMAPPPGFMGLNQMVFMNLRGNKAVLGGRVSFDLKAQPFFDYVGGLYTLDKAANARTTWQLGAFVPVGHAYVKSSLSSAVGSASRSDASTDIGDALLMAAMYWKNGDWNYKLVESIYVPTGGYKLNYPANVGRNYWGFDTTLVMTWLNMKTGTEVSIAPGFLINTTNSTTDYKSGTEFHIDLAVNRHYFAKHYAVGIHAYYYRQISGDSGSGARLGSFNGEALGVGPAFLWTPPAGKGRCSIIAKWMFDVSHTNRLHGDYGQLIISYKF